MGMVWVCVKGEQGPGGRKIPGGGGGGGRGSGGPWWFSVLQFLGHPRTERVPVLCLFFPLGSLISLPAKWIVTVF